MIARATLVGAAVAALFACGDDAADSITPAATSAASVASSSSGSAGPACADGDAISCTCPDGDAATQRCDDGAFGPCGPCGPSGPASSSSGQGGAGGAGGAGGTGGSGGDDCDDYGDGEPNEAESSAYDVGDLDDCDTDGLLVAAVVAGASDADWYRYDGSDTFGCSVDPHRALATDGIGLRLCKFIDCNDGDAGFDCPGGTTFESSPDGHPGCCGTEAFALDPNCDGWSDDATVFVRVDSQGADVCAPYTLFVHY